MVTEIPGTKRGEELLCLCPSFHSVFISVLTHHFNHFPINILKSLPCPQYPFIALVISVDGLSHLKSYEVLIPLMRILLLSSLKTGPQFAWLFSSSTRQRELKSSVEAACLPKLGQYFFLFTHQACHHLFSIYPSREYTFMNANPSLSNSPSDSLCLE